MARSCASKMQGSQPLAAGVEVGWLGRQGHGVCDLVWLQWPGGGGIGAHAGIVSQALTVLQHSQRVERDL